MSDTILKAELARLTEVWPDYRYLDLDGLGVEIGAHGHHGVKDLDGLIYELQIECDRIQQRLDDAEGQLDALVSLRDLTNLHPRVRDQIDVVVKLHEQYGVEVPRELALAVDIMRKSASRPKAEATLFAKENPHG